MYAIWYFQVVLCLLCLCLAAVFGSTSVRAGTLRSTPRLCFGTRLLEAWVSPGSAHIGTVLLSTITCAAHALQVMDVVVRWICWNDVIDSPIVAI